MMAKLYLFVSVFNPYSANVENMVSL